MLLNHAFFKWFFLGLVQRPNVQPSSPDRQKGGGMGGGMGGWVGLQKLITDLDMIYGYKGGVRV